MSDGALARVEAIIKNMFNAEANSDNITVVVIVYGIETMSPDMVDFDRDSNTLLKKSGLWHSAYL